MYFEKQKVFLDEALGRPYGSVFEIKNKRLELVDAGYEDAEVETDPSEVKDNRFLKNDGKSQKLTKEDIEALKDQGISGKEIIETLVENSTTFFDKNEYSKVKYLKKKKQKYLNYVVVLRPNARLLVEVYYAQGPHKILNLRVDSLGQILTMCNVHSGAQYMVCESCMGLLVGATLERLGGSGRLVYLYTGVEPTLNVLSSFNFTEKELECLLKIKVWDVDQEQPDDSIETTSEAEKPLDVEQKEPEPEPEPDDPVATTSETSKIYSASPTVSESKRKFTEESAERLLRRKQRDEETRKALNTIRDKNMDGLIIASKFHSVNILQLLMPFLALSRPFVVFCPYQQPLIECYNKLKESGDAIMLHLSETWLRSFQVLNERTHPMISMSGASGYILTGIKAEVNTQR